MTFYSERLLSKVHSDTITCIHRRDDLIWSQITLAMDTHYEQYRF